MENAKEKKDLPSEIIEQEQGLTPPKNRLSKEIKQYEKSLHKTIKQAQKGYFSGLIKKLEERLELESRNGITLRATQRDAVVELINLLKEGKTHGLAKIPTGMGKTIWFGEVIYSMGISALITVPNKGLVGQTYDSMINDIGYPPEKVFVVNPMPGETAKDSLQAILDNANKPFDGVIISTMQSMTSCARDKRLLASLTELIDIVVEDEAHRQLGPRTKDMIRSILAGNGKITKQEYDYLILSLIDKQEVEEDIINEIETFWLSDDVSDQEKLNQLKSILEELLGEDDEVLQDIETLTSIKKLNIKLTATPDLLQKSVRDGTNIIINVTLARGFREGDLVAPRIESVGNANLYLNEEESLQNITQAFLSKKAVKFVLEDGRYLHEAFVQEYNQFKEENEGYAPGVYFCGDIEHADMITRYCQSQGIRAVRCTSTTKDDRYSSLNIEQSEVKKMLEGHELDLVVTVSKAREGWDVPTIRAIINGYPVMSPAKLLQGVGRGIRTISDKYIKNLIAIFRENGIFEDKSDEEITLFLRKTHENTLVLEADWTTTGSTNSNIDDQQSNGSDGDEEDFDDDNSTNNQRNRFKKISGLVESFLRQGEMGLEEAMALYPDADISEEFISMLRIRGLYLINKKGVVVDINDIKLELEETGGSFVHEDKEYYPISKSDYSILNEYRNIQSKVEEVKEEVKTKNLKHAYVRVGNMPVLVLEKEVRDELIAEKKWEKIEYLKNEKGVDINPGKVRSFVHEDKKYYPITRSDYSILNEYGKIQSKVQEIKEEVKTKNLKHAYVRLGSMTVLVLEKEVLEKLIAEKKWEKLEKIEYLKNEKGVDINPGKVRSFVHEDKEYYPISGGDYSILNEYGNIEKKVQEVKEEVKTKNLKHAYVRVGNMPVLVLEKEVRDELIAEKKWEKIEYLKNEKGVDINPGKVRSFVHEDKEYYPISISDYSILNEYGNIQSKVEEVKEDVKTKNLKHAYVKSGSITILVLEKEVLEKLIAEKKWEKTEYLKNEKGVDINPGKVRSFVHEDKEYYPISISDYSILNEYVNIRSKVEEVKEDVKTKNLKHAYVKSGSMAVLILEKEVLENLIAEKKWEKKK